MTIDNFRFYLQNRQIQTGQTGDQLYSVTSLFGVPCLGMFVEHPSVTEVAQQNVTKIIYQTSVNSSF
jgi:hypothetical protein